MKINNTLIISLLFCFLQQVLSARTNSFSGLSNSYSNLPDSVFESQLLYNGRIWKNLFYMIREDQFLFSNQFLPGSVFIKGKSFNNIKLKYDIFKDEILIPYSPDGILQLTKELVDSFTIEFQNSKYRFARIQDSTFNDLKGFAQVLYKGKTALFVKFTKKIDKPAIEGEYDKFYQITRIYFEKDNMIYPLTGKADLLKGLAEKKDQVRNFLKENKLTVTNKDPGSFIPAFVYFDQINQ